MKTQTLYNKATHRITLKAFAVFYYIIRARVHAIMLNLGFTFSSKLQIASSTITRPLVPMGTAHGNKGNKDCDAHVTCFQSLVKYNSMVKPQSTVAMLRKTETLPTQDNTMSFSSHCLHGFKILIFVLYHGKNIMKSDNILLVRFCMYRFGYYTSNFRVRDERGGG